MKWVKGILRGILITVLLLVCAALFYVLVIMGDSPQDDVISKEQGITAIVSMQRDILATHHFMAL